MLVFGTGRTDESALAQLDRRSANGTPGLQAAPGPKAARRYRWAKKKKNDFLVITASSLLG